MLHFHQPPPDVQMAEADIALGEWVYQQWSEDHGGRGRNSIRILLAGLWLSWNNPKLRAMAARRVEVARLATRDQARHRQEAVMR